MIIRNETKEDVAAIYEVNTLAFGKEDEAKLVDQLRREGKVRLSLVAEDGGKVVGHLLLSTMYVQTETDSLPVLALAPVAVLPEFQKQGIGSALIREAIKVATERGEEIILVLGHDTYYPRFGFSSALAGQIEHPFPKENFMALELKVGALNGVVGKVKYPPAFGLGPEWTK